MKRRSRKLLLIETAVLLGVVGFIAACDGWDCQEDLGIDFVTCVADPSSPTGYSPSLIGAPEVEGGEFIKIIIDTALEDSGEFDCFPSDDGEGGALPTPDSMATAPSTGGGGGTTVTQATGGSTPKDVRSADTPAITQTGGGSSYLPAKILSLPFTALLSQVSQQTTPTCDSNAPDVLIVNHGRATLTRLEPCLRTAKTIGLVSRPLEVAVTPDGSQALVTNFDNAISFINLSTNTVSYTLTDSTINPSGIAITPDGSRAYVTSFNGFAPSVVAVDLASKTIVARIGVTEYPHNVSITPDGTQAWVAFPFDDEVDVIDTLTNTVAERLRVTAPFGIEFNPTGTRAYIASAGTTGTLVAMDTATFQTVKSYNVGPYPNDVNVLSGGHYVVVNNFGNGSISVIDTRSGNVITGQTGFRSVMGLALIKR